MPNEKKKAYCIHCGEMREYKLKTSREETTVRGTTFSYLENTAFCTECGEEVYIPEINDMNVQAREDAYRKASHLITISEVREILEKYAIGAGPLALLMGFGEVTITRYLGGQIPSREHSEKLLEVRASHKKMEEYLEAGKDRITAAAYQRCRKAIDKLTDLYGKKKIELVTRYILCKTNDITPMALQKLLYYAQAFYHALFYKDLFTDDCQAWAYGPVYPDVYYRYRKCGFDPIEMPTSDFGPDIGELTIREIELIDSVMDAFGQYSGTVLSRMTHSEMPWIEARGTLQPGDRSVTVVERNSINRYFDSVVKKYAILNPCEISRYSKACYKAVMGLGC